MQGQDLYQPVPSQMGAPYSTFWLQQNGVPAPANLGNGGSYSGCKSWIAQTRRGPPYRIPTLEDRGVAGMPQDGGGPKGGGSMGIAVGFEGVLHIEYQQWRTGMLSWTASVAT